MVLVDTSVWIEFFRRPGAPAADRLDYLLDAGEACVCGLIAAELVPGIRLAQRAAVREYLASVPHLVIDPDIWDDVGAIQERALAAGAGPFSLPDLVIAAVAVRRGVPVFSLDRHFPRIAPHAGLELWPRDAGAPR